MDWMTQQVVANWKEQEGKRGNPVWIDYKRLEEIMEEHTPKALSTTAHLPSIPGVGSPDPFVAASYMLVGNIWNAHFKTPGEPPYRVANSENPDKPFEGFMAFWHKLYQQWGENVVTADMIRPHVRSVDAMRDFFRDLTEMPLPELRQHCGLDFVKKLEEEYHGNPIYIFRDVAADGIFRAFNNGRGLVEALLDKFPIAYGEDFRVLDGCHYHFAKRARLVAMFLHQYAVNSGGILMRPLADINDLGPLAEYQLARWLHSPDIGVLCYSPELDSKIERGEEIPRGSVEEVLIRAGTVAALVYWSEQRDVPLWRLDPYIFSTSRGLPNKAHYTKCVDY